MAERSRWDRLLPRPLRRGAEAWGVIIFVKVVVGVMTGLIGLALGLASNLPILVVLVLVVAAVALIVWLINGVMWVTDRFRFGRVDVSGPHVQEDTPGDPSELPKATQAELLQPQITNRRLRIVDVPMHDGYRITGKSFVNCHLEGPAVLIPFGGSIQGCTVINAEREHFLWRLSKKQEIVVGAIALQECRLVACILDGVALAGPPEAVTVWAKGFSGPT